jgi:hypothetical protein
VRALTAPLSFVGEMKSSGCTYSSSPPGGVTIEHLDGDAGDGELIHHARVDRDPAVGALLGEFVVREATAGATVVELQAVLARRSGLRAHDHAHLPHQSLGNLPLFLLPLVQAFLPRFEVPITLVGRQLRAALRSDDPSIRSPRSDPQGRGRA